MYRHRQFVVQKKKVGANTVEELCLYENVCYEFHKLDSTTSSLLKTKPEKRAILEKNCPGGLRQ